MLAHLSFRSWCLNINTDVEVILPSIKQGENAEECAIREVNEEIGLDVESVRFIASYSYEKRDNLMVGFVCFAKSCDFTLSCEVDKATWFTADEAEYKLKNASIALQLLMDYLRIR